MTDVTQVPLQPLKRGSLAKLWLGILLLVAAALLLAWIGAGSLRGETTASGLQFRVVEQGTGEPIQAVDGVMIDYTGRLADGTEFESTRERGPVPVIAGQMIPGFSEALMKMREGGSYRVKIPADLAYGATPPQGSPIPPNADLEFDVSVRKVVRGAAMMMPPAGGAEGMPPEGQPQPQPEQAPPGQ